MHVQPQVMILVVLASKSLLLEMATKKLRAAHLQVGAHKGAELEALRAIQLQVGADRGADLEARQP